MADRDISGDRVDLIKRLFAVTISVGFASQLGMIVFDKAHIQGSHLDLGAVAAAHWRDGILLIISMIAVVRSWEGYLNAVANHPLRDVGRFYIDILLVFTYLMLLLSSQTYRLWFHLVAAIFFLYVLWDIALILAVRPNYPAMERGLVTGARVTGVWLGFFLALDAAIVLDWVPILTNTMAFTGAAGSALLGIVLYRIDKAWPLISIRKGVIIVAILPAAVSMLLSMLLWL